MAEVTIALSLGSAAATAISFAAAVYYAYGLGKAAGVTAEALRHATLDLEAIKEQREESRQAHEEFQEDSERIAGDSVDADIDSVWGDPDDREEDASAGATFVSSVPDALRLQAGGDRGPVS